MELEPTDLAPLERAKGLAAAARVRLEEVRDPDGATFDAAYRLLDGFFGPLGELEDRDVLARFVRERRLVYGEGLEGTYHLVAAWEGDRLVGVRDCYVDVDHGRGLCLVALSHSLVVEDRRRSGLGALLRAIPFAIARRELQGAFPVLVAAEMEPVDPARPDTVVRLVAYGRSGFSVLDPQRFRYSQPDFRAGPSARHTGLPLLGVVRTVGLPEDALPPDLVAVFPRLFHTVHRMYLPRERVDPSEQHALATLAASPDPVRLLPLPTGPDTLDRLEPLRRERVAPLYPIGLRGP